MTLESPLRERISWITNLLQNGNLQEIHVILPTVIDNIFGFSGGGDGWGLHNLKQRQNPSLFNCIRNFLSPTGSLLDCVGNKLTTQGSPYKYEFPPWLSSARNWSFPLMSLPHTESESSLTLNAFEFFLLSFLVYPVHPKWNQLSLHDFEESVYCAIFCDYLRFYLFTDPEKLGMLSFRQYSNRPFQQIAIYQRNYFHGFSQDQLDSSDLSLPSDQGLFWQSEIFLQTVNAILLGWHPEDYYDSRSLPLVHQTAIPKPSVFPNAHSELLYILSLKPSSRHVFLVRCFLKHMYNAAFNHMAPPPLTTPQQQAFWNKILNFHRHLYSTLCLPASDPTNAHQTMTAQLQQLLLYCFQHWPYDLSFEIVLETWLTAIQPWRYAETAQPHGSSTPIIDLNATERSHSPGESSQHQFTTWIAFATRQYGLYVLPLLLFLQRAVRMDLRVLRNAYMVHRVAKVLSQRGLNMMLHSAEEAIAQQALGTARGNYPESHEALVNAERTGLWGPVFLEAADRLIQAASSAQSDVSMSLNQKSRTYETSSTWNRFVNFLSDLMLDNGDREMKNLRKCDQYLNETIAALKVFFRMEQQDEPSSSRTALTVDASISGRLQWDDVVESPLIPIARVRPIPDVQTPQRRVQFAMDDRIQTHASSPPFAQATDRPRAYLRSSSGLRSETLSTDQGTELTPLGRFQILMGQRKPDIRFTGDREFLPPCSYELPALAELFKSLSGLINTKMRPRFVAWCSRPGFVGWTARQLLLSPRAQHQGRLGWPGQEPVDLDPKISLRWLASYKVLVRFGILYLISFLLFGIRSPVSFTFCLVLCYSLYQFVRVMIQFTRETVAYYWPK